MYGSDPFSYDFEGALRGRKAVRSARVTEDGLRKHAKRFGVEGVAEVAEQNEMIALAAELRAGTGKRQRKTTNAMRDQAVALHKRGLVVAAIADALNVSDARVKKLLRA